jgi:hypothetical protein
VPSKRMKQRRLPWWNEQGSSKGAERDQVDIRIIRVDLAIVDHTA